MKLQLDMLLCPNLPVHVWTVFGCMSYISGQERLVLYSTEPRAHKSRNAISPRDFHTCGLIGLLCYKAEMAPHKTVIL